jgi:hypothetical protein
MAKRLGALVATGGLGIVLMTGCGHDTASGLPTPGAQPKEWCFADSWVDRATWDYAYWQEGSPHDDADVVRGMGYGHRLMDLYQQDKRDGKLPADVSDAALKAWALNIAHLQGSRTVTAAAGLATGGLFDQYLAQVHAACN